MPDKITFSSLVKNAVASRGMTNKEFSHAIYVTEATGSRYRNGERALSKSMRVSVNRLLKDVRLSFASATKDYRIPTMMVDSRLQDDVYETSIKQRQEERERQGLEPDYESSVIIKPELRTAAQQQAIDAYLQNYAEEFAAEQTDFITKAEYAGYSQDRIFQIFDSFNNKYGVKE